MKDKVGKKIQISTYKDIAIGLQSVNCVELKTIFLTFDAYIQPFEELSLVEYQKIIRNSKKEISKYIRFNDVLNFFFMKESIIIEDIKYKAVNSTKKSYFYLEITLYPKHLYNIISEEFK